MNVPVPGPSHRLEIGQEVLNIAEEALGLGLRLGLVEFGSGLSPERRCLQKFRTPEVVRFSVSEKIVVRVEI